MKFERVSSFKYLGNVIHKEGRVSECVKDRIQVGNRTHAAKTAYDIKQDYKDICKNANI